MAAVSHAFFSPRGHTTLASLWSGAPLDRATRVLALLTAFSIPLWTSLSEIITTLFVACWCLSGDFAAKWALIRQNKVALLSLALFGLLAAGMGWSGENPRVSIRCLLKYRELVYLPMFVVVFRDGCLRS